MNKLIAYSLLLTAFFLSGCVTRVTPYEADRVDQELKGNRGVVRGKVPPSSETGRKKTKTMYDIEIELSSRYDDEISGKKDAYTQGNKGYIMRKDVSEEKAARAADKKKATPLKGFGARQTPQVVYQKPAASEEKYKKEKGSGALVEKKEKEQRIYVVVKGDTLQKISEKMYGTTKKWKRIYEANKDILKGPDLIKPGQKLVIPEE